MFPGVFAVDFAVFVAVAVVLSVGIGIGIDIIITIYIFDRLCTRALIIILFFL